MDTPLVLDGSALSVADVEAVARRRRAVVLGADARRRLAESRAALERRIGGGDAMYGINTGFGSLSRVRIESERLGDVQRNLIRSHASGVGEPLPADQTRALMLLLAASLARGRSGVRPELVEAILALLEHDILPVVPSRGSVGASGDLAPLAHVALALLGEGRARFAGAFEPVGRSYVALGLRPIELRAKEGLALINGTHLMTALGALAIADLDRLLDAAIIAAAMAIDGCRATDAFLDERLHAARRQPGPIAVAAALRRLLDGSTVLPAHRHDDPRVQDPYCLRAAPQVLGAALDAIGAAQARLNDELGAVTDNPLVFVEGDRCDVVSGGNFHGLPIALPLDCLKIAITHVAGIAERRVNWLLTASDSENPVTAYLSPMPGLHSGYMIAQYAAAACCNELQVLAHPASVHNLTTSAGIEDYNSFGPTSVHHLTEGIALARSVVAVELLVMAEAMEHQRPLRSGAAVEAAIEEIRSLVPRLEADRPPARDIATIERMIREGRMTVPFCWRAS
ncbi:MAG TPA: histidine ammonia-lyase [Phycisphaerales bacterium]|nr:histidine ammonia-lyase [Phycisphaerales bacterium]HMP37716.1 histidine ammonia-lyase [Phycisphaerales bacterium]